MMTEFPPRLDGRIYLTEGGVETEILYKWGFELPEFAMFPLLDEPEAMSVIRAMYDRYFQAAEAHDAGLLIAGTDYRASPDWGTKIGCSEARLRDYIHRNIEFLLEMREAYAGRVRDVYVAASIGPRGDAYGTGGTITADEAAEYHSFQTRESKAAGAEMVIPITFNNVPESIGAIRAAEAEGIPVGVSLTLTTDSRLRSGPTLREAVEEIDAETGGAAAWFGTNCSHPLEFEPALEPGDWTKRFRYVRPNAVKMDKVALCKLGHLEDGDPIELGQQMADVARRFPNVDILGGCCGTDERHLERIAAEARTVMAAQ